MLLKKLTKITAVLLAAAAVFTVSAGADDNAKTRASLEKSARSYLKRGNYTYAYTALDEYASLSREMAEAGELHPYLADTARAMADYYRFEPEVLALYGSRRFFRGSDGYVSDTANAVRLDVPFTIANVEDFYHFIPNRTEEVGVLVSLNVNTEKEMISIASGGFEGKIAENMRQLSRIEGQVYLTFCPGVDAVKKSRTIHMSYKNAYITIAEAARRYAPNVQLVYSVSDVPVPGEDTVSRFYPGDEYVDVFGVEVSSAFRADPFATEEELYWYRRGEFYDPVWSVQVMEEKFRLATGRECPLMVTGVSFPWDGRNSIDDYGEQMRGFYEKLPEVCPALVGIFYSGKSSSDAMCNLRSNPEAARIYEE